MKKLTILLITLLLIIILIGCDDDSREEGYVDGGQHMAESIELLSAVRNYDVQSSQVDIDINFKQSYFIIHQNQLHLFLLEVDEDTLNSYINLLTMNADGTNVQEVYRTLLDESVDFFNILGFEKHDDGYISLVTTDNMILPPHTREDYLVDGLWDFEISNSYVYRRIAPDGEIVSAFGIESLNNEERQIRISDVAFDLDGNAIASASWRPVGFEQGMIPEGIGGQSFFIFNNELTGDFYEVEDETLSLGLFHRRPDGQVIVQGVTEFPTTEIIMFYEVDFENIAITEGPEIGTGHIDSINGAFPAPAASEFDVYLIANDGELIGYRNSDGTFTLLIDFLEIGVPLNHGRINRNSFLLWEDGRITTVNMSWNASLRREEVTVFLLTPRAESDAVIEREVITLGGIHISFSLIDQATVFNRRSDTHQIEVVEYSFDDRDRLRTELIAGRGPDIFVLGGWGIELAAALAEGPFILDLYQMIDADPDINREDFFPNILSAWENSRGELVQIAPSFSIQTAVGMQSVFPEAPESWNYADFIAFYEEAREAGYDYPLGQAIDRLEILGMLLFTDDTFFCERTAVADFDSESFINVLNFVITLPERGWERIPEEIRFSGQWDPVGELFQGEKLLLPSEFISDTVAFRALQMRLGGITPFGFPSNDAPTHIVHESHGTAVGIRSNSPHTEAAWEFVRLSLLPRNLGHDVFAFPSRIDQFEQLISRELDRVGPTITARYGFGTLEVVPMTEPDAELLRDIISNIGLSSIAGHSVQNIVNEDVQAFFAGTRSAEDTARIIQSRVQRFLAERER
ncbi:MAG: hypothetical protein FWD05_04560 [Oscillospiraceae bacterium]|nr:hypothetical protein [Oscillospiraceae bacterium]